MHILFILQTAFSVWMLVDAIRRGAEQYWWVIVMFPFGEVAYFIAVVLPDLQRSRGRLQKLLERPPSLKSLRRDFEQTPSHQNRLRLAQGLHDAEEYDEASERFAEVLGREPGDRGALYGYARCCEEIGDREQAIEALTHLFEQDPGYLDYEPVYELAGLLKESGEESEAIEVLEALARSVHRVGPRAELGHYLIDAGRGDEARKVLKSGLDSYETSPRPIRRRDGRDARRARRLMRRT